MYSCKQVRSEFMPLFIASVFFLLYLDCWEEQTGLEAVAWYKEAGPALTSHVRQLQVNFGVTWSDISRTSFAPSNVKSTTLVTDYAGLYIEVLWEGHLKISRAYNTKFDARVLSEMQEKVELSLRDGSSGLMAFDEFDIMYEVLQHYHPGFIYAKNR
jgi:hypothetical protein